MIINKAAIQAALAAVTAEDTRYFMDAIAVQPDGSVQATDGHICVSAVDTHPQKPGNELDCDFPIVPGADIHESKLKSTVLIPSATAKRLLAAMPKKSTIPILQSVRLGTNSEPDKVIAVATDLQSPTIATLNLKDQGTFPVLDRVQPKRGKVGTIPVVLRTDVLETLLKAAKAVKGTRKTIGIRLEVPIGRADRLVRRGEKLTQTTIVCGPIRFDVVGDDVKLSGAVMPMQE